MVTFRASLRGRIHTLLAVLSVSLAVGACGAPEPPATGEGPLLVFAAASLKESMDEAAAAYAAAGGPVVEVSYAASSALARQIEQGAPADAFISADVEWMDWLQERGLIDGGSSRDLLGNELVLVAPADGDAAPLDLAAGPEPVLARLGEGRIAMALVDSVPAGKYGREAFGSLGMWEALSPRVAEGDSVRAALMLVARGEAPLGVVYGSDARAEPRVQVVATFPPGTYPPIVYPAARVAASRHADASGFVDWLAKAEAGEIFRRHGFTLH
jgi:molybdate transport system substrate-binding protein